MKTQRLPLGPSRSGEAATEESSECSCKIPSKKAGKNIVISSEYCAVGAFKDSESDSREEKQ